MVVHFAGVFLPFPARSQMSSKGLLVASSVGLVGVGVAWYFLRRKDGDQSNEMPSSPARAAKAESPSAAAVSDRRELSVVYGSATGTSELFGKALQVEAKSKGFASVQLFGGDTYTDLANQSVDPPGADELPPDVSPLLNAFRNEKILVLLLSTTGDGDPTDDFAELYQAVKAAAKDSSNRNLLSNLQFVVFGLGDTQYKYFCEIAKRMEEWLLFLGAKPVPGTSCEYGDVQKGLEDHFDEWREALWEPLAKAAGVNLADDGDAVILPEYTFRFCSAAVNAASAPFPPPPSALEPTQKHPIMAKLVEKTELLQRPDGGRSTLSLEIDITGSAVTYQGGDHCGVFAANPDSVVESYLKRLSVPDCDWWRVVELTTSANAQARANPANILPAKVALFDVFRWYVDLCGPPRKSALRVCARYCSDDDEKKKFLTLLSDPEQYRHVAVKARTVLGFLNMFPSANIPVGHFIEIMPKNNPRFYSIASDQLVQRTSVFLTVALVEDGLCSQYFKRLNVGDPIPIFVRKSTFHLPLRAKNRPLLLIGPGTGVAPLIGFCYRREAWRKRNAELGPCHFYFGCRRRDEDYLHRAEIEGWAADGQIISSLSTAFSREFDQKVYVQHLIKQNAAAVHELIVDKGANIYICGDAKHMAKDVERTLIEDVLVGHGGMTPEAAEKLLSQMERNDRYLKDVWTS